jgi:hypothetical protein
MTVETILDPLVKRKLFNTPEDAARKLARNYILQQIETYNQRIAEFERKRGMSFEQFTRYTAERTAHLRNPGDMSPEKLQILSQDIMRDEDDWLDWKVAEEMLESWLGLGAETKQ